MSSELEFADVESLQDLGTYVARARVADPEGAIRLQAHGSTLAAWVGVLPGHGMMREGVVLGLRVMPLAQGVNHDLDVTVPMSAIADRLARRSATGDVTARLAVPPTTVNPPWAALTPPRSGWQPVGTVPTQTLWEAAEQGVAEVASGAPEGSGAQAVADLRHRVWSRPVAESGDVVVPAGAGFAAQALGFLQQPPAHAGDNGASSDEPEAQVHSAGAWVRVSLPLGHVLTR